MRDERLNTYIETYLKKIILLRKQGNDFENISGEPMSHTLEESINVETWSSN